jgi:hypothetical protein
MERRCGRNAVIARVGDGNAGEEMRVLSGLVLCRLVWKQRGLDPRLCSLGSITTLSNKDSMDSIGEEDEAMPEQLRHSDVCMGRLSTYDSLANAASTFRQIQPKQSAVEDTALRQHAEAIACSLPRRPLRGGLRSNRPRKSHDTANSGGSAQHQPPSQHQRPLLLREHGAPETPKSDPLLFHRHFLPKGEAGWR